MNTYQEKKEAIRQQALDWEEKSQNGVYWSELAEMTAYFEEQARRFGLLREFRENGII